MAIARERIVPCPPPRATLSYGVLGGVLGIATSLYLPDLNKWALEHALVARMSGEAVVYSSVYWGSILLVFLPHLLVVRATQRWDATIAFAATYAGSLGIVSELRTGLARGDGGANLFDWVGIDTLLEFLFLVGASVLVMVLARVIARWLIVRTIEYQPGLCAWCGYSRGSTAIARCPECGRDAADTRFRLRWYVTGWNAGARHWRIAAMTACLVVISISISGVVQRTIPSARFYARFAGATRLGITSSTLYVLPDLPSVWLSHSNKDDRGIRITFEPGAGGRPIHMGVDVVGSPAKGLSYGSGHVVADLNEAQSAHVLANGLPDGLVRALYAKADEIAWTPVSAPRGAWEVDASLYFPK